MERVKRNVRPRHSHVWVKGTRGNKLAQVTMRCISPWGTDSPSRRSARRLRAAPEAPGAVGAARPPPPALRRERARAWGRGRARECASPRSALVPAAEERRRDGRRRAPETRVGSSRSGGLGAEAGTGAGAAPPPLRRLCPGPPATQGTDRLTYLARPRPRPRPGLIFSELPGLVG